MFGNTSFGSSSFGSGFGTTPTLGAFGSTAPSPAQTSSPIGTTIRFVPLTGTDSIQKAGSTTGPSQITTRHQIISAMKEYESKSVDELRLEDYAANRKVGQQQTAFNQPTPFGSMQPSTSQQGSSIFGAQPSTNLFATPTQNQSTSIFGQPKTGFGMNNSPNIFSSPLNKPATTVSNSPFNIGTPFNSNAPGGFLGSGQNATQSQPQPFGATNSIFGSTSNTNTSTAFGSNNLFNNPPKTGFEMNNTSGSGLFGSLNKPAAATSTASLFQVNTPFNTTMNNAPNIFSSPQTQPTTTVSNPPFNIGSPFTSNSSGGFLGSSQNATQSQPQPFGATNSIFGSTSNTNTSTAFGSNNLFNNPPKTGFEMNNTSGSGLFGSLNKPAAATSTASLFQVNTPFNTTTNNAPNIFSSPQTQPTTTVSNPPFNIGSPFTSNASGGFLGSSQNATQSQAQPFGSSNSILGSTPNTNNAFGTNNLFNNQPKTGFEMSNTTGSGLFGSLNKPAAATSTASLFQVNTPFNTTMNSSNNIFNSPQTQPTTTVSNTSNSSPDLLLNRLKTLPYGETSLFLTDSGSKFTTDPKTINQYKMNARTNVKLNKPTSTEKQRANSVLSDKLDDSTTDLRCAIDVFVPKNTGFEMSNTAGSGPLGSLNKPAAATSTASLFQVNTSFNTTMNSSNNIFSSPKTQPTTTVSNSPCNIGSPCTSNASDGFLESSQNATESQTQPFGSSNSILGSTPNTNNEFGTNNLFDNQPKTGLEMSNTAGSGPFGSLNKPAAATSTASLFQVDSPFNTTMNSSNNIFNSPQTQPTTTVPKPIITIRTKRSPPRVQLDRIVVVGVTVPKQQKVREIKLKPDLYAALNKSTRDIMSVCVAGSPKVRFFNGSRNIIHIQADTVIIQELKLVPALTDDLEERLQIFLEKNSLITPLPSLAPYVETHNFIQEASSGDLLNALYGNLSAKTPYAKQDERLNRLINWLASINSRLTAPTNLYKLIMYHMSCDRYDLASSLAVEKNHPRLALLVASLNLNKDLILGQLSSWRLSTADRYIDPELLKIYILLSGLTEWKLSNDVTVYSLKGLKWTQQLCLLALHFNSFASEPEKYGFHMLPLYIKRLETDTNDVDYHILARHSPANIISAAASLVEEWFLLESLKSFYVINSESECGNYDVIHCNLASQIGPIDLRWACFFALHITNNEVRNQVLTRCLEQNYNQLHDTVKSWLVEKLKIPIEYMKI